MESDPILTAKEVLEKYPNKLSLTTLWRLAKSGELVPCGRVGSKTRRWRQSAVEAYLTRFEETDSAKGGRN